MPGPNFWSVAGNRYEALQVASGTILISPKLGLMRNQDNNEMAWAQAPGCGWSALRADSAPQTGSLGSLSRRSCLRTEAWSQ